MRSKKKTLRKVVGLVFLMLAIIIGEGFSNVYADIVTGDGSSSSNADFKKCDKAERWQNVRECSSKHGGASWHVFKITNLPLHDENKPNSDSRPILTATLWDHLKTKNKSSQQRYNEMRSGIQQCPSGYYVAYVYDGWYGAGSNWGKKSLIYYGPLAWRKYDQVDDGEHHTPLYHRRGKSYTAAQVNDGFNNGTNMNGWRIDGEAPKESQTRGRASAATWKSTEATKLYRWYKNNNSANIPKGTGWFCFGPAPPPPSNDNISTLNITVNGQKTVYARPDATLNFHTDYYSGAHYGLSRKRKVVFAVCGPGWDTLRHPASGTDSNATVTSGYISLCGGLDNNVYTTINGYTTTYANPVNVVSNYGYDSPVALSQGHVGGSISGVANTSVFNPSHTKFYTTDSGQKRAKLWGYLDSSAIAYVPYNFSNETKIKNEESELAYAGEKMKISGIYTINPKPNEVTSPGAPYATRVPNRKYRFKVCIKDSFCYTSGEVAMSDANDVNINTGKTESIEPEINIPDVPAGRKVCVTLSIYPGASGLETNTSVSGFDGWKDSNEVCFTVAKRPSIQMWGGNVYSRGNLTTSIANKTNFDGGPYNPLFTPDQTITSFGSWGELGVVRNGAISGFGSGASMGYASNDGGLSPNPFLVNTVASAPSPGGSSNKNNYCDLIPLTIPSCINGNTASGLSSVVGITKITSDKESIVKLLASEDNSKVTNNYRHFDTDSEITASDIDEMTDVSTTKVVSSNGSITIKDDLEYFKDSEYTSFDQIPKLVIYAKNNIYIDCAVGRIDALLIANDTVVTCNNFEGNLTNDNVKKHINDPENSKQLIINGAIIAKRLIPNRTYGAATGANSIVPAEIVNFDPTLYQFGKGAESNDDTTSKLDTAFIKELAPRL